MKKIKRINFSFSKFFDNNKFVKVFAVLVAAISWVIVSWTVSPSAERTVADVPISFDLQDTTPGSYGLSIIDGESQTVDIRVQGKSYKLGNLTPDDFVAIPNLTPVTKPGSYNLDIEVRKINTRDNDYKVADVYTKKVIVDFDYIREKTFDVFAIAENITAQEGYVKEAVIANPNKVTLKGPQSEIDKISKCVVETDEKEAVSEMIVLDGVLEFYDENNVKLKLDHVTYPEQTFDISVQIYKHKVVPFTVNFVNVPPGLDESLLEYKLSEDTMELSGPKDVIDNIQDISLGEIDFRKINISSVFAKDVNIPAGVLNVNNTNLVTVSIIPDNLDKKQLSVKNIIAVNTPTNYNVKVVTTIIKNVTMVGNDLDIESLSANDLIARVDLQAVDLSEGRQRVPVTIYATGNKFVWAIKEYMVLVDATKK